MKTAKFPFTQLRKPDGSYYEAPDEMVRAGFVPSQMWSITELEEDGLWWVFGPADVFVDIVGYVATAEHHDGQTKYLEQLKTAEEVAAEQVYFCDTCED